MTACIVGVVEKSEIIKGDKITPGDVLIGVPSTGLHTNGYSLARKVLLEKYKFSLSVDISGDTYGIHIEGFMIRDETGKEYCINPFDAGLDAYDLKLYLD